jgi:hypothetical protein
MKDVNPYATPTAAENLPAVGNAPSTRRLWIAYAIAPLFAPVIAAVTVFVVGMAFLASHPEDTGTPVGVIAIPIFLLVIGIPASYVMSGLIVMPFIFWLRRRGRLNGYGVHGAALLSTGALALLVVIVGTLQNWVLTKTLLPPATVLAGALAASSMLAPFILLSGTAFWLIGVRQPNRSRAADELSLNGELSLDIER